MRLRLHEHAFELVSIVSYASPFGRNSKFVPWAQTTGARKAELAGSQLTGFKMNKEYSIYSRFVIEAHALLGYGMGTLGKHRDTGGCRAADIARHGLAASNLDESMWDDAQGSDPGPERNRRGCRNLSG